MTTAPRDQKSPHSIPRSLLVCDGGSHIVLIPSHNFSQHGAMADLCSSWSGYAHLFQSVPEASIRDLQGLTQLGGMVGVEDTAASEWLTSKLSELSPMLRAFAAFQRWHSRCAD
jgi:hypothetical protein